MEWKWSRESRNGRRMLVAYHDWDNGRLIVFLYTVNQHWTTIKCFRSGFRSLYGELVNRHAATERRPMVYSQGAPLSVGNFHVNGMAESLRRFSEKNSVTLDPTTVRP